MNLKLKNVKDYPSMSEETDCFQADLWVDNKKVAHIKNDGKGACNTIYAYKGMTNTLNEIEAYCKTLPKVKYRAFEMSNDLELETGRMMLEWRNDKLSKSKLILENTNGVQYTVKFPNLTITKMLTTQQGINSLKTAIAKYQKDGYKILNTNLGTLLK